MTTKKKKTIKIFLTKNITQISSNLTALSSIYQNIRYKCNIHLKLDKKFAGNTNVSSRNTSFLPIQSVRMIFSFKLEIARIVFAH